MSKKSKERAIQTEVKHLILKDYIGAWGGIILGGISRKSVRDVHFVYVDANAYCGWYSGDQSDRIAQTPKKIVYGSPIIGIEAFDELVSFAQRKYSIRLKVNIILVEKDVNVFQELVETLHQRGYDGRLVINPVSLTLLTDKQIAVINGDSTAIVDSLVNFTSSGQKFSLYFLDPYGASGVPLNYVEKIISLPRHDVIINFPYLDLHRKTGLAQRVELTIEQEERLRNCDRMFGHNRWRSVATNLDAETDQDNTLQLEQELVDGYRETLRNVDPRLTVKSIRMRFPERERTMYYLFLTTHDPTGALTMNQLLWDAKLTENELRWQLREKRAAGPSQLSLFSQPAPPSPDQPVERPAKESIAERIYELFPGKQLTLRDVYRLLAEEPFFASEVKSALRLLRRQHRVSYSGKLGNDSKLEFESLH